MIYKSKFKKLTTIELPKFSGTRILMMPFVMEDIETLPDNLAHYKSTVEELVKLSPEREGVGYLTIDEKHVVKGKTQRLKGLHVDGLGCDSRQTLSVWARFGIKQMCERQWNNMKLQWYHSAVGIGGMLTVSNPAGCRAWNKDFEGKINENGDCEHLREQFPDEEGTILESNTVYWCAGSCVHESLPMQEDTQRTFVRLSMPSPGPWYEGYTVNPKGIKPTGQIMRRHWLNAYYEADSASYHSVDVQNSLNESDFNENIIYENKQQEEW